MRGTLVIVSGPSGVGKTTVCSQVVRRLDAFLSVSATTRPRRDNEVDGRDYVFISKAEFERLLTEGEFLEHAQVYGVQYYGTPAGPVRAALEAGRVVILEIEIEGTLHVKKRFPDAIGAYMLAPNADDQRTRLVGRRQDSAEAIAERLSKADGEVRYAQECGAYQHFVVNVDVESTVETLVRIIEEHRKND